MSARPLTARMAAAMKAGRPRVALAEIDHPTGAFYGWTGVGDKIWNGVTYTGIGTLGRVTPIQSTNDLAVQDITFELSGVDADALALIEGSVKNGVGRLYLACLDDYENIIADPYLLIDSELDVQDFEAGNDGTCTIKITGHNGFWQLERQLNEVWSTENQKQTYPNDTGLDLLASLENQDIAWTVT